MGDFNQHPEQQARDNIDRMLTAAGWMVQDWKHINLGASCGVAVREHPTDTGSADYILYVNRQAVGVIEAKKDATNLASINLRILKSFPTPVPPSNEQIAILEVLNEDISNIDAQLGIVVASLKQLDAQRKNILKSAFSGKLVPQDPNDEPASELLARIRFERATIAPKIQRKRRVAA